MLLVYHSSGEVCGNMSQWSVRILYVRIANGVYTTQQVVNSDNGNNPIIIKIKSIIIFITN